MRENYISKNTSRKQIRADFSRTFFVNYFPFDFINTMIDHGTVIVHTHSKI